MSSNTSCNVAPSPCTAFSPPVNVRRIVGILTSTDIEFLLYAWLLLPTIGLRGLFRDVDLLLRDHTIDDAEGAYADRTRCGTGLGGRNDHVVRLRFAGEGDVGTRRVSLGRRVGMVDDDDLLARRAHLLVQRELLLRVETEERRRTVGV